MGGIAQDDFSRGIHRDDGYFGALHKAGFANQPSWQRRDDGLKLIDCHITASSTVRRPITNPYQKKSNIASAFFDEELTQTKTRARGDRARKESRSIII